MKSASIFLPQIGLWTRTSFEQNQAMGFTNITAVYEKGNISVNVSLTGQSGGGGGGLAGGLGRPIRWACSVSDTPIRPTGDRCGAAIVSSARRYVDRAA